MQIHELTKKATNESWLGNAFGLNKPLVKQAIGQVAGELSKPTEKSLKDSWSQQLQALTKRNNGQALNDQQYQDNLEAFIDKLFFKDRMELLNPAQKASVQGALTKVLNARNNPQRLDQEFTNLFSTVAKMKSDPKDALERWKGKVLSVVIPAGGGVTRPANFSWDGQRWIDAMTGQPATREISAYLTNAALGKTA